jgi:excisionase family DNA binding protein
VSKTDAINGLADEIARRLADPEFLVVMADHIAERLADQLDQPEPEQRRWMSADEVAGYLGVKRTTVYAMGKDGTLTRHPLKEGRRPRVRYERAEVERLIPDSAPSDGRG